MRRTLLCLGALAGLLPAALGAAQAPQVLINHVGYSPDGPKHAVVLGHEGDRVESFAVLGAGSGAEVLSGPARESGAVQRWKDWRFWTLDFDGLRQEGTYVLECRTGAGVVRSEPFAVQANVLERNTLSDVVFYFKGQRCSGLLDRADRNLPFSRDRDGNGREGRVDLHGGWYDASGDFGKHLTHLSHSTYFNPQQITIAAWSLFKTWEALEQRGDANFRQYKRRLLDEAIFGADYLARSRIPGESFYVTVSGWGPEKAPEDRVVSPAQRGRDGGEAVYPVSYRSGGGVAIAALAMAARAGVEGDYTPAQYLAAAEGAFEYLEANNERLNNDGAENIVDDYCALMAATELLRTTGKAEYRAAADRRARSLIDRLVTSGGQRDYWRADGGDRPFFHAADGGLPAVSLLYYAEVAEPGMKRQALAAARRSLAFELRVTAEVANPFGYSRQYVQNIRGERRTSFFIPHETETRGWWQGENARLGSMAAAARLGARAFAAEPAFRDSLRAFARDQLNWILGLNPFDVCMLEGSGRNNPWYEFRGSYEYANAPGGIVNGITSGLRDEEDIDFHVPFEQTGEDNDWRWTEQWLPHAAWYLIAVGLGDQPAP